MAAVTVSIDRVEAIGRLRAALEGIGAPIDHLDDPDIDRAMVAVNTALEQLNVSPVQVPDALAALGNALGGRT